MCCKCTENKSSHVDTCKCTHMLRVTMHNNIFIKRDIKKYFFDSVELKGKPSHYGQNVQCKNISGG